MNAFDHYEQAKPGKSPSRLVDSIPHALRCPITLRLLVDPVEARVGYTHSYTALMKWFQECKDDGFPPMYEPFPCIIFVSTHPV